MWYTGKWSPNGDQSGQWNWDQSGQWRSISMRSQWPLIMTSQWVMTLLRMPIVKSQWVMTLLGTSLVMSQWINDVAMCTYGITMHNDIAMNLFYYVFSALCLFMILLWVEWNKKQEQVHVWSVWNGEHIWFVVGNIPTQTQLMCSPQTGQTLACSYYNILYCIYIPSHFFIITI